MVIATINFAKAINRLEDKKGDTYDSILVIVDRLTKMAEKSERKK